MLNKSGILMILGAKKQPVKKSSANEDEIPTDEEILAQDVIGAIEENNPTALWDALSAVIGHCLEKIN